MAFMSPEEIHRVVAEYDRAHPPENHYDRRLRERREAKQQPEKTTDTDSARWAVWVRSEIDKATRAVGEAVGETVLAPLRQENRELKARVIKLEETCARLTAECEVARQYIRLATGPKGEAGRQGERGERGARGEKGSRGERGPGGPAIRPTYVARWVCDRKKYSVTPYDLSGKQCGEPISLRSLFEQFHEETGQGAS